MQNILISFYAKSPETEAFVQSFNSALAAMRDSGALTEIVGEQN